MVIYLNLSSSRITMIGSLIFIIILLFVFFALFLYKPLLDRFVQGRSLNRKQQVPSISVIIPAYNEERYIVRKIQNIKALDYPKNKLEIIVVDNGSTDKTQALVKKMHVKLLTSERGKHNALRIGIQHAKYSIVALTDADTTLSKNALRSSVQLLHGNVAAVGLHTEVLQKDLFYWKEKKQYHTDDWYKRYKEGVLDSCCSLDGKFILSHKRYLQPFMERSFFDDFEITLALRKQGLRSVIDNQATVYEECPLSLYYELKQIRRRIGLGIRILLKPEYLSLFCNKKYGFFGLFILPFRRFLPAFLPVLGLYLVLFLFFTMDLLYALALLLLGVIGLLILRPYTFMQLLATSLAWVDVLTRKSEYAHPNYWKKIAS